MSHLIDNFEENPNHPCYGKSCKDCDTCIFDVNLFEKDKVNMNSKESCHLCSSLVKNYVGDERLKFNACCNRSLIGFSGYTRPRIIKANTGPMLPLDAPEWCPKKRGITKEYITQSDLQCQVTKSLPMVSPSATSQTEVKKPMTYTEKREKLLSLPKHLEWENIEEGCVYVIPKILTQSRKVVRVVMKTDTLIRCSEIDEYGKESQTLMSLYPKDIDIVFITKVLRF